MKFKKTAAVALAAAQAFGSLTAYVAYAEEAAGDVNIEVVYDITTELEGVDYEAIIPVDVPETATPGTEIEVEINVEDGYYIEDITINGKPAELGKNLVTVPEDAEETFTVTVGATLFETEKVGDVNIEVVYDIATELEGVDYEAIIPVDVPATADPGDEIEVEINVADGYYIEDITINGKPAEIGVNSVTVPEDAEETFTVTVGATLFEEEAGDTTPDYTPDPSPTPDDDDNTGNTGNSGSATTPTVSDQDISGDVDVTPGTDAKVETDAGEITVKTDAEDEALAGATFVVESVKAANVASRLTSAVGSSATEETKALVTAADKAVSSGDAVVIDFSFEKDGKDVQPGKDVTLTVPVPEALKGASKVYIYHVSDEGVTFVDSPVVKDGEITFTATAFSPYIFSKVELKSAAAANGDGTASEPDNTANPGSNPSTGIGYAFIPALLAAGAAIVSSKKRK